MLTLAPSVANASKALDVLVTNINVTQTKPLHLVEVAVIVDITKVMMIVLQMLSFLVHPHGDFGGDDLILMW